MKLCGMTDVGCVRRDNQDSYAFRELGDDAAVLVVCDGMGGERNGTCAFAKGKSYPSSDHYGRVYTMRGGQPEHVVVIFYNIAPGVDRLDRVDISMGLAINTLNIITMRNVPIFRTYSDKAIRNFVRENATKVTAN